MRGLAAILPACTMVLWAGCATPRHAEWRSSGAIAVSEPSADADRLWGSILDTLRGHGFQIDRVDRPAGVITTLPETSKQFLEFWRNDVATARDTWEATLNPIRRRVEVTVVPAGEGTWQELAVAVYKERLSSPDRQFNSTGAAYQYFGDSLPSTTGHYRVTTEHDRWLALGRDPALEDCLLAEILAASSSSGTSDATP